MKWTLIILAIPVGLYVLVVTIAGFGLLLSELKFRKSPYRDRILEVINLIWEQIKDSPIEEIQKIAKNGSREEVLHQNQTYSSDVAIYEKSDRYEVLISVGIMSRVTFGHTKKFELNKS